MASFPGPPPSIRAQGHSKTASVRLRRAYASTTRESSKPVAQFANQETMTAANTGRNAGARTKHDLFPFQHPRQDELDFNLTLAALRENVSALTALNQREKALSTSLKEEVARLTASLAELKEIRDVEKMEQQKSERGRARGSEERILPDIHSSSTLAVSTAALQQSTPMETSYQRRVLSLETRCLHMTENNKKLLVVIQQLGSAQAETKTQLEALQLDNTRLVEEAESCKSTINSQSALIVGLRSTVQKMNRDEKLVESLRSSLEQSQRELAAVKTREKVLREEHVNLKVASCQETEALKQQLEQTSAACIDAKTLEMKIKTLEEEKEVLEVQLKASNSLGDSLQIQVTQLNELLEESVPVTTTMESDMVDVKTTPSTSRQELGICIQNPKETEVRATEGCSMGISELTVLLNTREKEVETLMQKVIQLEDDVEERNQRCTALQGEIYKVGSELQGIKQLSDDDVVQALQMARQKAATYEALTLLNEEKEALEEQLRLTQELHEAERIALYKEQDGKKQAMEALDARTQAIDELQKAYMNLLEKNKSRVADKAMTEAATQTVEEIIDAETAQTTSEAEENDD